MGCSAQVGLGRVHDVGMTYRGICWEECVVVEVFEGRVVEWIERIWHLPSQLEVVQSAVGL